MSKPESHRIALTPAERAFVVDVLDAAAQDAVRLRETPREVAVYTNAMLTNEGRAGAIAAVIKAWPVGDDGMIEIVLLDDDRKVFHDLMNRTPPARGTPCRGPDLFDSDDHTFTRAGAKLTGNEIGRLRRMFWDYELDIMAAREILLRSDECWPFFTEGKHPVMHAYLRNIAVAGVYIDDPRASPAYHVNVFTARFACAEWERAGVCTLRREPAGGRRKYDRVHIDWREDMWLPPDTRRKPRPISSPLQDVDDRFLEEMVA